MKNMITLFGPMFENIGNEGNLFPRKSHSEEYEEFYKSILRIIHKIIQKELNINQKKFLLLFLNNKKIYDISKILNINNSTVHQNFNLIVKKISLGLIKDDEFLNLLYKIPTYIRENMFQWIEDIKRQYKVKKYSKCPVCKKRFQDKYEIKKHILKEEKKNNKLHKDYYKRQIKFIREMLKQHGFSVKWIYKHDNYLLFSLSWIWNYWRKHYDTRFKRNLFKIFKKKASS